jgi:hypothetical protein
MSLLDAHHVGENGAAQAPVDSVAGLGALPAIADAPQKVPIGPRKFHQRRIGDLLHPALEPAHILAEIKARMGTMDFSAQYLQRPIPAEGNMIKHEWIKLYRALPENKPDHDDQLGHSDEANRALRLLRWHGMAGARG